ncbi:two-component system response regulator HydG [Catalinimonas alkaloidigena]|uniref:sigma-54-dependent transcriptional regulator n=1 Tax=Catalinimonas alkaloidigena TaxID=1075417 RepID=UPI002404B1F3|nr:sigma-54 dependent transcriptional regulator [Catalinimonas alkaloidigena]MDF9796775.1 two-component system response regulator HydG [Catalinimonas alkaloidigena]
MDKKEGKILIIDDDQAVLYTAKMILKQLFTQVRTESHPSQIMPLLEKEHFDVILLDMNFVQGKTSGQEGLFWIKEMLKVDEKAQIVVTTAYGDIDLAVNAMKEGAVDFLTKPWEKERLAATIVSHYHRHRSEQEVSQLKHREQALSQDLESSFQEIISQSEAMDQIFDTIKKVSVTDANVLILGENGTGKELVARAIHRSSPRAPQAFIKVDLGAVTETLFESELFGHAKGAFTGAVEDRAGRFEIASGGTLFLDEIGNLSLPLQAKLLTALQSKQIVRVGTNKPLQIDVRLISATNMQLYELAEQEHPGFRQDLLYRINTVEIQLPPLRKRQEDISVLVHYFLDLYGRKYQKPALKINERSMKHLRQYHWPGNVRELQHAVERAVIMSDSSTLDVEDFLLSKKRQATGATLKSSYNLEEVEKQTISEAIRKHSGNLSQASKELGMGRSTLYRKMKKYGL